MSSTISGHYTGDLRMELRHEDSGATIVTDAPKDNNGLGRAFSPTDLFASSLAACMLTIMAIKAKNTEGMPELDGACFRVQKVMASAPRRISALKLVFELPSSLGEQQRLQLERSAMACPVHASLSPEVDVSVEFLYTL